MKITVRYRSIDRYAKTRTFKTLAGAQRFAARYVGETPELGSCYAVSGDGVGRVTVEGATLRELFPKLTDDGQCRTCGGLGITYGWNGPGVAPDEIPCATCQAPPKIQDDLQAYADAAVPEPVAWPGPGVNGSNTQDRWCPECAGYGVIELDLEGEPRQQHACYRCGTTGLNPDYRKG